MPPSKSGASLSNIEIAQHAKMKPIVALAKERLGIPEEHLSPFGHYKAKISLDYCTHLGQPQERQAHTRHGHLPHPGGRRQDDDDGRPRRRAEPHRQEGDHLSARTGARPGLRHERRRGRRRLRPGRADGGHQPPLHRRLLRDRAREQPARGADRQSHPSRQRGGLRRAPHRLASRRRLQRSGTARHHDWPRRARQRLPAPGRLRHRRRFRSDGDLLPRDEHSRTSRSGSARSSSATRATTSRSSRATSRRTARWRRS